MLKPLDQGPFGCTTTTPSVDPAFAGRVWGDPDVGSLTLEADTKNIDYIHFHEIEITVFLHLAIPPM